MKLLLFSDLHADEEAAEQLLEMSDQADLLIGAGDIGNLHRSLHLCVDVLRQCKRPALLVPGNNETTDELRTACRNWPEAIVLHGETVEVAGVRFFGMGGGIPPTPFGSWSFDFTEEEATEMLRLAADCSVWITHSPPYGAADVASSDQHLGSPTLRAHIEKHSPQLVVCGHVHRSAGTEVKIGPTTVINAGPSGILWDLPSSSSP